VPHTFRLKWIGCWAESFRTFESVASHGSRPFLLGSTYNSIHFWAHPCPWIVIFGLWSICCVKTSKFVPWELGSDKIIEMAKFSVSVITIRRESTDYLGAWRSGTRKQAIQGVFPWKALLFAIASEAGEKRQPRYCNCNGKDLEFRSEVLAQGLLH